MGKRGREEAGEGGRRELEWFGINVLPDPVDGFQDAHHEGESFEAGEHCEWVELE